MKVTSKFETLPKVGIVNWGSISCLGSEPQEVALKWSSFHHYLTWDNELSVWVSCIDLSQEKLLRQIQNENKYYAKVDRCVLLAMYAARKAMINCNWQGNTDVAVNIGTSRGVTGLLEKNIMGFYTSNEVATLSSPLTTQGNIASFVANDLRLTTASFGHSVTCSSASYALANGYAWLVAGLATKILVGGVEAPLTSFTIAQMQKLNIYSKAPSDAAYPCMPLGIEKKNSVVLGEGCAIFGLEIMQPSQNYVAQIRGIGIAQEKSPSPTGITPDALALQLACQKALEHAQISPQEIDIILTHAPGTFAGDFAELRGLKIVFHEKLPFCYSPKWKIGHLLGASSALSIELALLLFSKQILLSHPYPTSLTNPPFPTSPKHILINSLGFGGNAMSIILSNPNQ